MMDRDDNLPMEPEPRKDLGVQGDQDAVKGKLNKMGGKAQEKAGELTSNRSMEAKGKAEQMQGGMRSGLGRAERRVDDALDDDEQRDL
jgi:uncharacterized protein YjbJ (UPF0337 family)